MCTSRVCRRAACVHALRGAHPCLHGESLCTRHEFAFLHRAHVRVHRATRVPARGEHVRMSLSPPGVPLCDVTPCGGTCTVCVCMPRLGHARVRPQHACALAPDALHMPTCLHGVSEPALSFITPLPCAPFGNGCVVRMGRRGRRAAPATGKVLPEDAPAGRGTRARRRTVCTSLFALGWAMTADDVVPS